MTTKTIAVRSSCVKASTSARRILTTVFALGTLIASQAIGVGSASAATCRTESDACRSTYLCFEDYETGCWGRLSGYNRVWDDFGWGDRADWFENHGTRCRARVFTGTYYGGYLIVDLARGEYQGANPYWDDADSNNWYSCN